jgi:sulfatase modifying factor 1
MFCALSALFFSASCSYDTTIPNATLSCTTADGCPSGYACALLASGAVCCKDGNCGVAADAAADAHADAGRDLALAADAPGPDAARPEAPAVDAPGDHQADERTAPPPDATVASDGPAPPSDGPPIDVPPDVVDAREPDAASPPDVMPAHCPPSGRGAAMVWIESANFCIDGTEVTNGQYQLFLDAVKGDPVSFLVALPPACRKDGWKSSFTPDTAITPWPQPTRGDQPVVSVDWCDAWAFCQWAGKRLCGQRGGGALVHGGGEASDEFASAGDFIMSEWAYACTAAGTRLFPYGDAYDQKRCNTGRTGASSESYLLTKIAGSTMCEGGFPGLFDLSGNVEEWVDGCTASIGRDDKCAVVGGSLFGQSASAAAEETGCATSGYATPRGEAYQLRGFRCCGP